MALIAIMFSVITANAQIEVSGGTGLAATYPNFTGTTGLFAALNANAQTGNVITVSITADITEPNVSPDTVGLNAGAWTSITITPSGNRVVTSASITGTAMLKFNGADNVIIDGLNTGGNSLTISNTTALATSGTSTIRFYNGASNNTLTNCFIQGSGNASVATNGGVIFISTDAISGQGNDNITISNCDIGPAGVNLPTKCILGNGSTTSTAVGNSGIVIRNNNIHDYFGAAVTSAGIATNGGCNNWTIDSNRFYQSATRTWTTGANHSAMTLGSATATSGMQGAVVINNVIGYSTSSQTGTYTLTGAGTGAKFWGIHVNGISTGTLSRVSKNTIANVSLTGITGSGTSTSSPFIAIHAQEGLFNTDSNTIGSQSVNGSMTFSTTTTSATDIYGIYNFSSSVANSRNNNIGGISATNLGASGTFLLYPLRIFTGTAVLWTASNNVIGGTVANSIQLTATGIGSQVVGLFTSNAPCVWTGNTIRNLTSNVGTGTATTASVIGMQNSGATSANHTISQNVVHTLTNTNTTAAVTVTGMIFGATTGTNTIEKNFIHSLSLVSSSATATINGIVANSGTATYKNNMVRIGIDAAGNSVTAGCIMNGFNELGGTNNVYNNSIYVGGSGVITTAANSFAFTSIVTTNARSFRDNIFFNARSNGTSTGKHYGIRVGGTTVNPSGLTSDYNLITSNGTGAVFGLYNSIDQANIGAWRTATGQDNNSLAGYDPQFIAPTGTASTVDLHISPTNPTVIEGSGILIAAVADDFDGAARSGLTPTDIGADAGNFVAQDVSAPSISYTALGNTGNTGDRALTATITDLSGVPTAGALQPRIYYRKNAGTYVSSQGTLNSGTATNGTWGFTIAAADLGGVAASDVINYFVIAQDVNGLVSSNPSAGLVASDVNTVTTPPTSPSSYTVTAAPLSGTYTIGTAMFRPAGGGKLEFVTRTRMVERKILPEKDAANNKGEIIANKLPEYKESDFVTGMVEETYQVPMLNGVEYTGSLYHEYTQQERQQLGLTDNMAGDYATIAAAITDLNLRGVGGPVIFSLTDPSYSEGNLIINITNEAVTTSVNTITIRPAAGVTAAITSTQASLPILKTIGCSYFTIDGNPFGAESLTITNNSATAPVGIHIASSGTNIVSNVTVKNLTTVCGLNSGTTTSAIGIAISDQAAGGFGNGYFNGVTVQNCTVQKSMFGILAIGGNVVGTQNAVNISFIGNNLATSGANCIGFCGIGMQGVNGGLISQNTIANFETVSGINHRGIWLPTAAKNIIVERNNINTLGYTGTGGYGNYGILLSTGELANNNIIRNNVIADLWGDGWDITGSSYTDNTYGIITTSTQTGIKIYNNSIFLGRNTLNQTGAFTSGIGLSTGSTADIRNNSIVVNAGLLGATGIGSACIFLQSSASQLENSDYNNLFANATGSGVKAIGRIATVNHTTLSAWRTAVSKDVYSLSGDPAYTSATDLMPDVNSANSWTLSGNGVPGLVTNDYNGTARSTTVATGTVSIGAYEYEPIAAPPTATASAAPANSTTTTYTVNGKTIASVDWGAGGTVPTTLDFTFFPGVNPPGSVGFPVANGYWVATPTGGSGYTYDITINYDPAMLGDVNSEADIRMAKSENGGGVYEPFLVPDDGSHASGMYTLDVGANTIKVWTLPTFSTFALGDVDLPLPVELSSFTSTINKNNVDLNWSTVSEENNVGFDIERKLVSTTTWSKVGFVAGAGNSNVAKNYTFSDRNLATAKYNYRLKQIDNNGNVNYHNLSGEVIVGVPSKFDLSQNYPNPFNPSTKINYDLPFDSKVSIKIFDMTGKEVATIVNSLQTAGYHTVQFNGSNLASGVYFYNIIAEGGNAAKFVTTKKMVLVK
jgi:hypothetical protein